MDFLHKYRTSKFRPDIELGPPTRARSSAFLRRGSYEEVPLGLPANKDEQAREHDLLRHKDAFGRSPDLKSVISRL
jgi:hypothetical protein